MYKILLVDDEPLVRICMKTYLDWQALGFTFVGEAADGVSALRMISQLQPDIVLMDIKMPKMDGIEVLKKLQVSYPKIKVIMLSSFNDFQTVRESFKNNVFDYIHKPAMTEESLRETFLQAAQSIESQKEKKGEPAEESGNITLQRQYALRELLDEDLPGEQHQETLFAEYGFFSESESVAVIHFRLQDYLKIKSRYSGDAAQRLTMVVSNLIRETMKTQWDWEFLPLKENHYVLAQGLQSDLEGEKTLRTVAERIKENITQFLNANVVMGCSGTYPREQIRKCYQEGLAALNYNLMVPDSTLLFYWEMQHGHAEETRSEGHIELAIEYISQHYAEPISLETVAQVVGLNKSYLSRLFKIRTGDTLVNYINQCRIRKAAELLRETNLKSYEIAEMVGYNNVEYFNQVFKKVMGVSPREYR